MIFIDKVIMKKEEIYFIDFVSLQESVIKSFFLICDSIIIRKSRRKDNMLSFLPKKHREQERETLNFGRRNVPDYDKLITLLR